MSNKVFVGIILALAVGAGGYLFINQATKSKTVLLGVQHPNQGQTHIARGQSHAAYNSDPPSSGPHYNDAGAPTAWGVYTQEVPAEVFVHNEEHGGIIVTYRPDLPKDQLSKLQKLFAPPYSNPNFRPTKGLVTPRAQDTHPIELAAWTWTLNLDHYDEATIMKFYLQHVGNAPEPTAGPTNTPIDQAAQ